MKISGIDKDFVDIVYYLDNMGFKPFASCDGVEANHKEPNDVSKAYIAFLESDKIIDLMAAFLKDKEKFSISLGSESHFKPYEMYGNLISGTTYQVSFLNEIGQNTDYFESIIRMIAEEKEPISSEDNRDLEILDKTLKENSESDLSFRVSFSEEYKPYMGKNGRINELIIQTKVEEGRIEENVWIKQERDLEVLAGILANKYNIPRRIDGKEEKYPEIEFIISEIDKTSCSIYFTYEHLPQILEIIKYAREIAHTLPVFESKEWVGSDEELYNEIYIEEYGMEESSACTPLQQRESKLSILEKEAAELLEEEKSLLDTRGVDNEEK